MADKADPYLDRVTLQDIPQDTRDSYGQALNTPVTIGTYWAYILPITGTKGGREVQILAQHQNWPYGLYEVKLEWLGADVILKPNMRFVTEFLGLVLNIISAVNMGPPDKRWVCFCKEHSGAI